MSPHVPATISQRGNAVVAAVPLSVSRGMEAAGAYSNFGNSVITSRDPWPVLTRLNGLTTLPYYGFTIERFSCYANAIMR